MGLFDNVKALLSSKPATLPPQTNPTPQETQRYKILIVDDDPSIRQLYFEILSNNGYEAIVAENGQIGLTAVQTQNPQLVLLDLMMPVMDGKAMLHQLRAIPQYKTLPVIVLTNAGDAESIREVKTYESANEFLIKSNVTPDEILQKVKSLLP